MWATCLGIKHFLWSVLRIYFGCHLLLKITTFVKVSRSFSKFGGIFLMVVFAFFFASTNLCVHTHDGLNGRIVHSHPWSGKSHSHTGAQFQLISNLSVNTYDSSSVLDCIDIPERIVEVLEFCERDNPFSSYKIEAYCLRGPPMFI